MTTLPLRRSCQGNISDTVVLYIYRSHDDGTRREHEQELGAAAGGLRQSGVERDEDVSRFEPSVARCGARDPWPNAPVGE
jgi:hypothetical protein